MSDSKPLAVSAAASATTDLKYKSVSNTPPKSAFGVHIIPKKGTNTTENISLSPFPVLSTYIVNPYTDSELRRFEEAARKNHAIKSALLVREHFVFGKGSELVIELVNSQQLQQVPDRVIQQVIDKNPKWQQILSQIKEIDDSISLVERLKPFYWQALIFGRACIAKIFKGHSLISLVPLSSRRLGDPVIDASDYSFQGLYIDGTATDKAAIFYAPYSDYQITPHTEFFGYSAIESVAHVGESLNIALEEDMKEIIKSAWLVSMILQINTQGLSESEARIKMRAIIDEVKAGKYIGVNDAVTPIPVDLKPDFNGLVSIVDKLEQIIYKALNVPQFLVQNEGVANRATALQSAQLFLSGVIAHDQEWISNILQEQWYDPLLEELLPENGKNIPISEIEQELINIRDKEYGNNNQVKRKVRPEFSKEQEEQVNDKKDGIGEEEEDIAVDDDDDNNNNTEAVKEQKMIDYLLSQDLSRFKIRVKRKFNQAKISEFIDLADAVIGLTNAGIWDIQKANEILGSEEVTSRVIAEKEKNKKEMQQRLLGQVVEEHDSKKKQKEKFEKDKQIAEEKKALFAALQTKLKEL